MLEAKNLHKVYNNGKKTIEVLRGIDLHIAAGEFAAIVGPSGAGKSTLLHILGGLDIPTQGEVFLGNENIYKLSDAALSGLRNKRIGFVFQFYHLLPEFNALENVLMPALIGSRFSVLAPRLQDSALELLQEAGLSRRVTHFPNQLSGGEQQRVAIARALINKPDWLFCDEPTGNLDSKTGDEIISLIKKIRAQNRMSVVLVTHNIGLAKAADRIYHLQDGVLVN